MTLKSMLTAATLAAVASACALGDDETPQGDVRITIRQALTGQTTSAGTFTLNGALQDDGQTTEELTFGGPLTQPTVPLTFRRVITGRRGAMTITGSATLTWTSQTAGSLSGTWSVESGSGAYATGRGTLSGTANFAATPPSAELVYTGVINR
jgi:hypothetical protein